MRQTEQVGTHPNGTRCVTGALDGAQGQQEPQPVQTGWPKTSDGEGGGAGVGRRPRRRQNGIGRRKRGPCGSRVARKRQREISRRQARSTTMQQAPFALNGADGRRSIACIALLALGIHPHHASAGANLQPVGAALHAHHGLGQCRQTRAQRQQPHGKPCGPASVSGRSEHAAHGSRRPACAGAKGKEYTCTAPRLSQIFLTAAFRFKP